MTAHALDFPALNGQPVTEAHAQVCRERGHATHTVDGVDSGTCPRCGEVLDPHPAHDHGRATTCPGVETPAHLRPEACYVCGASEHADTTAKGGHRYWSNAQADREIRAEARRGGGTDPAEGAAERIWGAP